MDAKHTSQNFDYPVAKAVKVAICDDDEQEREFFYQLCKNIKDSLPETVMKAKKYAHGEALLFDFEDSRLMHSVDIVLLDINMPGRNGIETARILREYGYQGSIIFVTRSDHHWRSAFDLDAFNYITKDKDVEERFRRVFLRAVARAQSRRGRSLLFSSVAETKKIEIDSISHFSVNEHMITVYYNHQDSFVFTSSLVKVQDMLVGNGKFMRVHRAHVISLSHVQAGKVGANSVVMENGMKVPVSRRSMPELRKALAELGNPVEAEEE